MHLLLFSRCLSLLCLLLHLNSVHSAQVNVSIDDTDGDSNTGSQISYSPALAWQAGQLCSNCTAKVDGTQAYDGTWHDATYNPPGGQSNSYPGTIISASASFTGTAVYVYCILTRSNSSPTGNSDMTFYIDGTSVGSFSQAPNGDTSYQYNQLVFSQSGLTQGQHTVRIDSGHSGAKALVLLDRIVYTTDDSDVTTTLTVATSTTITASSSSQSSSSSSVSSTQQTTGSSSSSSSSSSASTGLTLVATSLHTSSTSVSTSLPSLSIPASASTTSDADPDATSTTNAGAIVGATVGSVGGLVLVAALWWLCARREKRREREEDEAARAVQPFFPSRPLAGTDRDVSFVGLGPGPMDNPGFGAHVGNGTDESTFRGTTAYMTLPKTNTHTLSSPTSLDSTRTPPPPQTNYTAALLAARARGEGRGGLVVPDVQPDVVDKRTEEMRFLYPSAHRNQTQAHVRTAAKPPRPPKPPKIRDGAKASPFSPTSLYSPTQPRAGRSESEVVSPTTASATLSGDLADVEGKGDVMLRSRAERMRRGKTNGRVGVDGTEQGFSEGESDMLEMPNPHPEPVSPVALLRPNRRGDPAPFDDRLAPKREQERVKDDDEGSDVRWQRKLVDLFTPSGVPRVSGRSLPTPPVTPIPPSATLAQKLRPATRGLQPTPVMPTPPPPYQIPRNGAGRF